MVVWVVFSGFTDAFFIGCGLVSCAIALFYAYKMKAIDDITAPLYLNPRFLPYYLWLCKEIFVSSCSVALKMWQPTPDVSPNMGWIKASQTTAVGKSTYANSITLTPGTVCLEVDGDEMCIHALTKDAMDDLKLGDMDKRVTKVTG
jgi:multicomponent Na+:H+ antiporter subunit E